MPSRIDIFLRLLNGCLSALNTPGGHILVFLAVGWYGVHVGDMEIATFAGGALIRGLIIPTTPAEETK
jgi:hypothetical protein